MIAWLSILIGGANLALFFAYDQPPWGNLVIGIICITLGALTLASD